MYTSLFPEEDHSPAGAGWYTAHCDGGSRGNPGPAGYGAVIEDPTGNIAARLGEFLGRQTNNYAEYQGLLAVLQWAIGQNVQKLRIYSDSELMVNQMKGRYKIASPALRPLWEEAKRRAVRLEQFDMRHTLRGGNKEADRLANEAMDRGMGKKSGSPMANPSVPGNARQALEGYVKNGVIHLLEGELPEGTFVRVVPK